MYKNFIKRLLDIIISFIGIIVLIIPFMIISLIIKVDSKGPIIFKQERMGKNNDPFKILKFRTMRTDTPKDCPTHLLENPDYYITSFGKFLRKTSLDELPQIWNIFVGEMSIIGPRPSLPTQFDLNALREQNGASSAKPGLTGLAQISGRDELPIEVKAKLDGVYASRITFMNDASLFFKTFLSVFRSDGVKEGKT